jgi:uncharacterized protein YbgA (DUF1722 family)
LTTEHENNKYKQVIQKLPVEQNNENVSVSLEGYKEENMNSTEKVKKSHPRPKSAF